MDLAGLVKLAGMRGPEVVKLLDELGVNSLKSLVAYSDFAGPAERGLVELEVPGPRKGVLGLFRGKSFKLADVPALPPDVIAWSMASFDAGTFFDVALQTAETVAKVVAPDSVALVKGIPALVNVALGLDLRKDLLAALDDKIIGYNAQSEGPFTLGQVVMVKVKDADKVKESLEQIIKAIARLANSDIQLKKHTFRDVQVREVRVCAQGFIFVPSYAIHKGWLCIALFPQPVHGFIARANGDMAAWKPSPTVRALLDDLPKDAVSISYSDPRPSINQILSLGPTIAGSVLSFYPESSFQIGTIPTAQEVTRFLFPNCRWGRSMTASSGWNRDRRCRCRSTWPASTPTRCSSSSGLPAPLTGGATFVPGAGVHAPPGVCFFAIDPTPKSKEGTRTARKRSGIGGSGRRCRE